MDRDRAITPHEPGQRFEELYTLDKRLASGGTLRARGLVLPCCRVAGRCYSFAAHSSDGTPGTYLTAPSCLCTGCGLLFGVAW